MHQAASIGAQLLGEMPLLSEISPLDRSRRGPAAPAAGAAPARHAAIVRPRRFLLIDDHPLVRRGLRQLLQEEYPEVRMDESDNVPTFAGDAATTPWDLVLLDLTMPGVQGLEALARVLGARPDLRVLVVSMHDDRHLAMQAVKLGAAGYITKDSAPEKLTEAVAAVLAGEDSVGVAPAAIGGRRGATPPDAPPHARLSAREFRVLCMLAGGRGITDIANELGLSVKTVSTYRARVLEKFGAASNAELVKYCLHHGLVH
ncbi:MAG: response regulator transcription factor [Burkholderiales bacterium]|nr:response regulator transcription factor [Burkholderiales bacterium]